MPQTPTLRRLMQESRELSSNPPAPIQPNPTFHAAPLLDNLHEWHFTLLGPPSTPYAGGIYHGRIVLPPTYPLRPPSFRFLTPSGRFEVNREICLSISGFHEESWQPAWGVRLALTALRVFMTEEGKGQVGGLEASESVRKQLAERSRGWKCLGCDTDGKTNEEIMKEWWECCREKGVQVGEDGEVIEGTGNEAVIIPEELRLGYRDELGEKDAVTTTKADPSDSANASSSKSHVPEEPVKASTNVSGQVTSDHSSESPRNSHPPFQAPQTEQSSSPPSTSTTGSSHARSQQSPLSQHPPSVSVNAKPSASNLTPSPTTSPQAQQQTPQQQLPRPAEQVSTPWLDRAISGIGIALLFMVLKKIFYV